MSMERFVRFALLSGKSVFIARDSVVSIQPIKGGASGGSKVCLYGGHFEVRLPPEWAVILLTEGAEALPTAVGNINVAGDDDGV